MHRVRVDPRSGLGGQLTGGDQLFPQCDQGFGPTPDPALAQLLGADPLTVGEQRQRCRS